MRVLLSRSKRISLQIGWILAESVYFYAAVLRMMLFDRAWLTGFFLIFASPYILTLNAVMRFVPREHEDKVLPFVYTMQ